MLMRITLDERNEKYAGAYNSPKPSQLPTPRMFKITPFGYRKEKRRLREEIVALISTSRSNDVYVSLWEK